MDHLQYKFKRQTQILEKYKPDNSESIITVSIPPENSIQDTIQQLKQEQCKASNIKSKKNRESILTANTRTQNILKQYNDSSFKQSKGIILYVSLSFEMIFSEKDENLVTKVNQQVYSCDTSPDLSPLKSQQQINQECMYILIDGQSFIVGMLTNEKGFNIIHKQFVSLPKKHNKGGQSSVRFARLADQARDAYVDKCCDQLVKFVRNQDEKVIIGGCSNIKNRFLQQMRTYDQLSKLDILEQCDTKFTGVQGIYDLFNSTIQVVKNHVLALEKQLVRSFLELLNQGIDIVQVGIQESFEKIEERNVKHALCSDQLSQELMNKIIEESLEQNFKLSIVSDKTPEGQILLRSFQGIMCHLHFQSYVSYENDNDEEDNDDSQCFI